MQVLSINENYKGPGIEDSVLKYRLPVFMKTTRVLELMIMYYNAGSQY
jgi:hypothetical protein